MGRNDKGVGAKRLGIKFGAKRQGANWFWGETTCYPCGHTSEKRWECSIGEITFLAKLAYSAELSLTDDLQF